MLITGIRSRPVYDRLQPMPGGLHHVLAGQGSGGQALLRLLDEMTEAQRERTTLLYSSESFSGQNHLDALKAHRLGERREYPSNAALVEDLRHLLGASFMGTADRLALRLQPLPDRRAQGTGKS